MSTELALPTFDHNGLVSPPHTVERNLFTILGRITILPDTCAILTGTAGYLGTLTPGTHLLFSLPAGPLVVQHVDMRVRQHAVAPVTALSLDKWHVTIAGVLHYRVRDPLAATAMGHVAQSLDTAARTALLAVIERAAHDALTGRDGSDPQQGVGAVCAAVVDGLALDPSLAALTIISFHITERTGDERRITLTQEGKVSQTRIIEDSHVQRLEHQVQMVGIQSEMAAKIERARLDALTRERARLDAENAVAIQIMRAEGDARMALLERAEQQWRLEEKRLEDEWRIAREFDMLQLKGRHDEAMAAIQGTALVSAEAARAAQGPAGADISPLRRLNDATPDIISQGLQVLKDLPSADSTYGYFLPTRLHPRPDTPAPTEPEGGAA